MKGKILLLLLILIIASVTVTAYQVTSSNSQLGQSNVVNSQPPTDNNNKDNFPSEISDTNPKADNSLKSDTTSKTDKLSNQANSNNNEKSSIKNDTNSKNDPKTFDPQSIAQKYIEEPGAVAGKPEQYVIGGKNTYVVPVLLNGSRVGEIDIDPITGKNVGGAGGAP